MDLQFDIVAKGDLAVLRRRVVCSRGEHQSTIKCICRVYLILFKGQRLEIRSVVNIGEKDTDLGFTCTKILREGTSHEFI